MPHAPEYTLRAGTPDDLPFLTSLAPRLVATAPAWRDQGAMLAEYPPLFAQALHDPGDDSAVLVACCPLGRPLGFTLLYWHPHERGVFVKDLAVSEAAQGQGVGRFLMAAAEAWGRQRGAVELMLKTSWFNTHAREFYAHAGFREDHVALVRRLD
ncbi:GNAT family N-acetyltransferase [Deinococcus koreensis]|uniref:N-acetyltransferase domain-containing protein n=1 Tax=Deinococcus koreensis TaxID=2054903 RepID=A0A2K3UWA5_9DEIO|nr:GNAT family N-acetyltransferase [Deinococcus koreensis]PNY80801.1 hypothetical protein CVO96_04930 [Deinococcus koreensis]